MLSAAVGFPPVVGMRKPKEKPQFRRIQSDAFPLKEPSDSLLLSSRNLGEIRTMEEWRTKREAVNQGWVPGKSAWETANAWVGSGKPIVPKDFQSLIESHESTKRVVIRRGEVERKTHLHHRPPSGPRSHDLGLWATGDSVFLGALVPFCRAYLKSTPAR